MKNFQNFTTERDTIAVIVFSGPTVGGCCGRRDVENEEIIARAEGSTGGRLFVEDIMGQIGHVVKPTKPYVGWTLL